MLCSNQLSYVAIYDISKNGDSLSDMAGVPGFEPGHARIKTWCLTAWRYPI
ncbi:protein of unknown function [Xenorhabdus poinarii G6]|uniref:Uncharacterized protein n=1 Tax=Xenorhabdus poinarii G6 TaxID=1354304 RepID=A0A068R566_9GAMM|nr:protein of unknown function [Xenorhabdus poinarii G6]